MGIQFDSRRHYAALSQPSARFASRLRSSMLLGVILAGCAEHALDPAPRDPALTEPGISHFAHSPAAVNQDLAALRALTARFHDVEVAKDAGWNFLVPGCRDNPGVGGMGWHYLNEDFLGLELNVLEPQILVYEPQKNGRYRFVAVEYIVPYTILARSEPAPELLGQKFVENDVDELWMLHVWVGRNNPEGLFESWNPHVSCEHAQ
jgi:hypothetical protein